MQYLSKVLGPVDSVLKKGLGWLYQHAKNTPRLRLLLQVIILILLYRLYCRETGSLRKKKVAGKHVFITGGGMGLGKGFGNKFAALGSKVTLVDINEAAVSEVAKRLQSLGKQAQSFKMDVSSYESVELAMKEAVSNFGPVDILINNAGIVTGKGLLEASPEEIKRVIDVNCTSHHFTAKQVLPGMFQRNEGHVVTIASMAGHIGVPGLTDYCASKFGAVGFSESLRLECKKKGSRVKTTCICPYYINTGMFNGVSTPFYAPILEENYVVRRVVDAILQDEELVYLPFHMGFLAKLTALVLPIGVRDRLFEVLQFTRGMDTFKGRK